MRSAVVVGVLGMMAGSALAQPGMTQPVPPPAAPPARVRATAGKPVEPEISEDSVASISLGATLVAWSVFVVGAGTDSGTLAVLGGISTMIAPSVGTWRAGGSSLPWVGLRVVGAASILWGLSQAIQEDCSHCGGGPTDIALVGGLGLYIVASVGDIATAPAAARAHNRALHSLVIAPMVRSGGGGLVLGGQF